MPVSKTYQFIQHGLAEVLLRPLLQIPFWPCSHGSIPHPKNSGHYNYCKNIHEVPVRIKKHENNCRIKNNQEITRVEAKGCRQVNS